MIPLLFIADCVQEITSFFYRGEGYLIFSHRSSWVMMLDQCAHLHIPLSTGWIENGCIVCPWHQWKYNANGNCVWPPGSCSDRVPVFSIQEKNAILWLVQDTTYREWDSIVLPIHWKDVPKEFREHDCLHFVGFGASTRFWYFGETGEQAHSELLSLVSLIVPSP